MSGICAFFGHRDTPYTEELEKKLEQTVRNLINLGFDEFWCCEQGTFDWLTRMVMQSLKKEYPFIVLCYVCPYNPDKYSKLRQKSLADRYEVIYPDVVASVPPQVAIVRRNRYIADNADVIVCYIRHNSGGAYKAVKAAERRGIEIINLAAG